MSRSTERRTHSDRRKAPRGGRRPQDQAGFTPLVLVVGDGRDPQRETETILGELKFAVAPAATIEEALRAVDGVHPDLIVARPAEAARLRANGPVAVPIVEYDGEAGAAGGLVDRLLQAVRKAQR